MEPDAAADDDAGDVDPRRGCLGPILIFCTKTIRIRRRSPRAGAMASAGRERVQGSCHRCAQAVAPQPPPATAAAVLENPKRGGGGGGGGTCGRPRDWGALPDLPLFVVARRVHSLRDLLSFRGVCTSWRSVGTDREVDVMASHPVLFMDRSPHRFYHPREGRLYTMSAAMRAVRGLSVVGQSHGHVIVNCSLEKAWIVMNPITGVEICRFPSPSARLSIGLIEALLSAPPTSPDCVIVAYNSFYIEYCRLGDKAWCVIDVKEIGRCFLLASVAVVGGKGYALFLWQLATFDLTATSGSSSNCPPASRLLTTVSTTGWFQFRYIAESKGLLFAFPFFYGPRNRLRRPSELIVARLDPLSGELVKTEDLGGQVAFVRRSRGVSLVDGDDVDRWVYNRDCIYFFDERMERLGKFSMKDGTLELLHFPFADPPQGERP